MSRVSVELVGKKEIDAALAKAASDVKDAVETAVVGTALELRNFIVKSLNKGPASGVTYRRGNIEHTASAPGQPPMTDTGRLANNIYFERLGARTASVGSTIVYAAHLEYGTRRGIAARPFFRPAAEAIRPKFMKRMEKALGDALR